MELYDCHEEEDHVVRYILKGLVDGCVKKLSAGQDGTQQQNQAPSPKDYNPTQARTNAQSKYATCYVHSTTQDTLCNRQHQRVPPQEQNINSYTLKRMKRRYAGRGVGPYAPMQYFWSSADCSGRLRTRSYSRRCWRWEVKTGGGVRREV